MNVKKLCPSPMSTRSSSFASIKGVHKYSPFTDSTNDDILHAIANLKKAKEIFFSQNKLLGEDLKSRLDMLTTEYIYLKN